MSHNYPNLTITFLLEFKGRLLLVKRNKREVNFPDLWAFPGGKVEFRSDGLPETAVDTIRREVEEETGLQLSGQFAFLDAFSFSSTTGMAFLLRVTNDDIKPHDFKKYAWVNSIEDLKKHECIPGIYNHLVEALKALERDSWQNLDDVQLTPDRYLNR